jgi:hypothetical protein
MRPESRFKVDSGTHQVIESTYVSDGVNAKGAYTEKPIIIHNHAYIPKLRVNFGLSESSAVLDSLEFLLEEVIGSEKQRVYRGMAIVLARKENIRSADFTDYLKKADSVFKVAYQTGLKEGDVERLYKELWNMTLKQIGKKIKERK